MRRPLAAPLVTASFVVASFVVATLSFARRASADTKKYALAMPHFNVQYVAGGMTGFWPNPDPRLDLNAEQEEDLIVEESFEPLLDLFVAHPTWATDVEMQAYMLDVIAARHPGVLAKLVGLSKKGQIEIVSFHYSDQFFLAHAPEDLLRSADLTVDTFSKLGLTHGGAVFCQEGQAAMRMADVMKTHGQSVLVWPKNQWSYQLGDAAPSAPLFQLGDVLLTTTHGGNWTLGATTVQVGWTFVDDGELLMTGGRSPYTPDVFKKSDKAYAEYETQLASLEASGFAITTVSKFADEVKTLQKPPNSPTLLDGTWQPSTTDGVHKWLGGAGLFKDYERDGDVHSLAAIAHRELVAAKTIADAAGIEAKSDLDGAWRLLALGEVSDASGINPFRGEVEYGIAHCAEALRIARATIVRAKKAMGAKSVLIDPVATRVTPDPPQPAQPTSIAPPMNLTVDGGDRKFDVAWTSLADHTIATVRFSPGETQGYPISVTIPGAADVDVGYTPALTTTPVHLPRAGFVWDHFMLALHDGLLAVGDGKWVLADQAFVHVAARIEKKSGDVVFQDETTGAAETVVWVFHFFDGDDAKAAAAAAALNVSPAVIR